MGMKRSEGGVLFWVFLSLISNNLIIIPLVSATQNTFEDGKTYYSPPHTPSGGHHHHHHHVSPTPSSGSQVNCRDPPPSSPPPSHGGSGGGCACPTPPTPSGGHHGGSGGYYPPTPQTPSLPPVVPSPPPYNPPVTVSPPPYDPPVIVSPPSHGGYYGPPSSPLVPSPPIITPSPPFIPIITPAPPLVPGTPFTPVPFDPNCPPFPCTYWGSHPGLIFGVVGWWATVGGLFGVPSLPGLTPLPGLNSPSDYTVKQLLNNPSKDPYTSLYREASASYLNSMATKNFPFTTNQVRDSLLSSLGSEKEAAKQARVFRLANEGKLKVESNRGQP